MKRSTVYYLTSAVLLIVYCILALQQQHQWGGWLLLLFFVSLALAFRQHPLLKGLTYTLMIMAVVSLAMYHPQHFKTIGSFKLSGLIIPLLQIIMFGMGTELSLKDFANVLRMPKGIIVGVVCHYVIMPLVGFAVAKLFNFPNEIAAGIILVGCCPSGLASNVMCYLAKGNLALSVSVTTISTMVAPFLTPLLMRLLGGSFVDINFWGMVWDITKIVIIPVAAGLAFHYLLHGKSKWLDKAMPLLSMGGIAIILTIITAAGRDNLLQVGALLLIAVLLHNVLGYFMGYWSARLLHFHERDCRTIALEVGMQNAGLASGLALAMGKLATAGLAPAIFGPVMNITGSSLASWWHNHPPGEDKKVVPEAVIVKN
ncbi:bile acid:sodium symporter family protein [Pseudoflavitalea sp. X16]|uniref:bile acid:sodium symporter family protein n=1 Tax=Paraflavitalea devenefica TaxID=2716334 RepID=UPI00141DFC1D|nr:bile acid:sodium symporter family protein [Paraflavitalea devenefica]NII26422.1 bile acid:sodium symporter family protein [Paraflavitalea devenefica]